MGPGEATSVGGPEAGGSHRYRAFISYSHRDRALGEWLAKVDPDWNAAMEEMRSWNTPPFYD